MDFEQHYNDDWTVSHTREYAYCLRAEVLDSGVPGLGKALVLVRDDSGTGELLFSLDVTWQEEVTTHG